MLFDIAHVHAPPFMPEAGFEWHLLPGAGASLGGLQSIQAPIEGEQATTGRLRELDPELFQSGSDTISSQVWIPRQASHFVHVLKRDLARRFMRSMRLVMQTRQSFRDPP